MDYFSGITNEKFIKDFLTDLYSVTEFVHQVDKVVDLEDIEPDSVYGKHIIQVQSNMCNKLIELIDKHNLSNYEVERIYNEKRIELFTLLSPIIDEYELKIKVNYGH
jgi:hypothetical protein